MAFKAAEPLAGQKVHPTGAPKVPTFKELGERWTSGDLAKHYPDQIREKRSSEDDEQRLSMYIYPIIGPVPIDRVTLDMAEDVMRRLPPKLEVGTRRNIGQLITRLLSIAVYPLRLISMSPIPRGFLPKPSQRKALAHLYPSDDARLLGCVAVPLAYRILWGFLTREGMRLDEALRLTWTDFDLQRGAVRLDKNKTNYPRAWALQPGTAEALRVFRERFRPNAEFEDRVFLDEHGRPFTETGALGLPPMLRAHLKKIGLHLERPELFDSTDERRQIRVHDLRGTFVTIALANGRSEAWVSDRTGHRSSQMIARYKRTARTFAELQSGDLEPLDSAIPEFRNGNSSEVPSDTLIGPGLAPHEPNYAKLLASPAGFGTLVERLSTRDYLSSMGRSEPTLHATAPRLAEPRRADAARAVRGITSVWPAIRSRPAGRPPWLSAGWCSTETVVLAMLSSPARDSEERARGSREHRSLACRLPGLALALQELE